MKGSGGKLAIGALKQHGVDTLFTLTGGHIFPFYEGCVGLDVRVIDTRHEQTATFAAEGMAKLTREPGVVALTAGPGVTNGVSAITAAHYNGSSLIVLGGRAPKHRWGSGSLQEMDHLPVVQSITKRAVTVFETGDIPAEIDESVRSATASHRGPVFVDVPMDVLFSEASVSEVVPSGSSVIQPDPEDISSIAKLLVESSAPLLITGTDVYWDAAWEAMRMFVETARIPVFMNGMGRGTLPADHELAFSRARSAGLNQADLIIVAGTPLDFRLRFGQFDQARVVHLVDSPSQVAGHVNLAGSAAGDLSLIFDKLTQAFLSVSGSRDDRKEWIGSLLATEQKQRGKDRLDLDNNSDPIHPARIYGELLPRLDRDAIVIGDGGDFVSYAGKYIDSYLPGCWMDPGPFGCLGMGLGYAIAARLVHPEKQVVLLLGDGAFGFSAMDFDTLVRFNLPVVAIICNNGIWGLEKHPMQMVYGYHVAADLQSGCHYEKIAEAVGGYGEFVTKPEEIGPAIDRAFKSNCPALVNIVTDPAIAYPRSSNLA